MGLLAMALKAKADRGYRGLGSLWFGERFVSARPDDGELSDALDGILESGAPCLRVLEILSPGFVPCLPRLTGLEVLHVHAHPSIVAPMEEGIVGAGGAEHFLPTLRGLTLQAGIADYARPFFALAQREAAFRGVRKLTIVAWPFGEVEMEELGAALAAGAFASLEEFEMCLKLRPETVKYSKRKKKRRGIAWRNQEPEHATGLGLLDHLS